MQDSHFHNGLLPGIHMYQVRQKIIVAVVAIQVVIILGLLYRIVSVGRRDNVLGSTDTAVKNQGITKFGSDEYVYYYVLEPDRIKTEIRFWDASEARLTINKDGLNERFDYDVDKPVNAYRIMVLGDSFAYGQFIDTPLNWTERLEDMINDKSICPGSVRYEVINLGVLGFDVPYIIKRFNDIGKKYFPDLIIWYESGSGLYRDREKMDSLIIRCEDEAKKKGSKQTVTDEEYSRCWGEAQDAVQHSASVEEFQKRYTDRIEYFWGIKGPVPVVFFASSAIEQPHEDSLRSLAATYHDLLYTRSTIEISTGTGLAMSEYDGHPNEKGHVLIANEIFEYLRSVSRFGISCSR